MIYQGMYDLEDTLSNLHTVALTNGKTGCTIHQLMKDYADLYGEMNFGNLGFTNMDALLRSRGDMFYKSNGRWFGRVTEETALVHAELMKSGGNKSRSRSHGGGRDGRHREGDRREAASYGAAFTPQRGGGRKRGLLHDSPYHLEDGNLVAQMLDLMNPHLEGMTEAEIIFAYNQQYGSLDLPYRSLREFFVEHLNKFRSVGVYQWSSIQYPASGGGARENMTGGRETGRYGIDDEEMSAPSSFSLVVPRSLTVVPISTPSHSPYAVPRSLSIPYESTPSVSTLSHSPYVVPRSLSIPRISTPSHFPYVVPRSLSIPQISTSSHFPYVVPRSLSVAPISTPSHSPYDVPRSLSIPQISTSSHFPYVVPRSLSIPQISTSSHFPYVVPRSLSIPCESTPSISTPSHSRPRICKSEVDALITNYLFESKLSPSVDVLEVCATGSVNTVTLTAVGAPIVFKVKCSNNQLYRISPVYHSMGPGTQNLQIIRLDGEPSGDVLLVEYARNTAGPDVSARDAWKNIKGRKEFKIRIFAIEKDEEEKARNCADSEEWMWLL